MSDDEKTVRNADEGADAASESRPSEKAGWLEENIRSWRAVSDRLNLTGEIEEWFATGHTAQEVQSGLEERLAAIDVLDRRQMLVSVRASLGIPSRMTAEGEQAFQLWKQAREQRLREGQSLEPMPTGGDDVPVNEIGIAETADLYRERDAANASDASAIRARQTPPSNEVNATALPENPEELLGDSTQDRLRTIREADRARVQALLNRDSTPNDDAVKPAAGMGRALDAMERSNNIRPKPILEKFGYEVPKSVRDCYVAHEGKFLDRKSETVHFEDKGRTLATASEDRDVIQHMVAVAQAKNWGELQLKGTEEFRRQAWIAAELAGVPSRGFKPKAHDRASVEAARDAMRITAGQRVDTSEPARTNTLEHGTDASQGTPGRARSQAPKAAGAPRKVGVSPDDRPRGASKRVSPAHSERSTEAAHELVPAAVNKPSPAATSASSAAARSGVTAGVLVGHGVAPFNHDEKQNDSYFATVRSESGEHTVWGLDLERAIAESGVQQGQRIELEKEGSRQVTAQQRQFDESGKELEPKPVSSLRNQWVVYSPDVPGLPTREQRQEMAKVRREIDEQRQIEQARDTFLSGNWKYTKEQKVTLEIARERIKEQAAREVLEDEIKALPERQKERLRGEFESAVAEARATNRPLDVPMPQVSESTIEAIREQIGRERAEQGASPTQRREGNDAGHAPHQPAYEEVGHDTPSLELEP